MVQTALKFAGLEQPVYEEEIIVQDLTMNEINDNADILEQNAPQRSKGRPRSEKSRKAILKAANALLLSSSVQDLSIEAIAKKAKVGKTTIYRWWPNKAAIVMEALMSQPGLQKPMSTPVNNADAVKMQLDKLIHLLDSKNGEIIAQLFSEAQADEKAKEIFEQNFLAPLIDAIEYSVVQGQLEGEFRKTIDPKIAVDVLCGPVFFRLMSHGQDLDTEFRENFPVEVLRLISA